MSGSRTAIQEPRRGSAATPHEGTTQMLRQSVSLLGLLALVTLSGCRRAEAPTYDTSLVDLLLLAEVQADTVGLDFGTPEARTRMLQGWGTPQTSKSGIVYAWGTEGSSALRLTISRPSSRQLILSGWPLLFPGAPEQTVEVVLNGQQIGELHLERSWQERSYRLPLPEAAQIRGENLLEFRYAYSRRPADVMPGRSQDRRSLAVAWTTLRVEGVAFHGLPRPEASATQPTLILPFETALHYYVDLPQGGMLSVDQIRPWDAIGSAAAEETVPGLTVRFRAAGSSEERVLSLKPSRRGTPASLRLPVSPQGPARISFTAEPSQKSSGEPAGLRLVRPMLETPRPLFRLSAPRRARVTQRTRRPNIILYLVDTLRADHLGCYGYSRPTSPNIDAFAAEATLFSSMFAQSSWTRTSIASLFTGLDPLTHGTTDRLAALSDTVLLLPEILQEVGYQTAGVITNGNISPQFGFDRGFDSFEVLAEKSDTAEFHQLSDRVNDSAFSWLATRNEDRPFFLYLHTTDPHGPYAPRSPYREAFAPSVADADVGTIDMLRAVKRKGAVVPPRLAQDFAALYDAEIAFNDNEFGLLIRHLKELGLYASTLIVFTSDHGEEFLDHGFWEHGASLFNEQLHIPFILTLPQGMGKGVRVAANVAHIDLLPTLLEFLGEPVSESLQGRSLLPLIAAGETASPRPPAFGHLNIDSFDLESVILDHRKLIRDLKSSKSNLRLYDLSADWGERKDLRDQQPIWAGYLLSLLKYRREIGGEGAVAFEAEIDDDLRQRLEALGYLD